MQIEIPVLYLKSLLPYCNRPEIQSAFTTLTTLQLSFSLPIGHTHTHNQVGKCKRESSHRQRQQNVFRDHFNLKGWME